ncbi:SIR2 family protein [Flavobacterium ardleyense]|uniref:SIR2 family protein n=1 Tax=Flavobacterium ardleyense TaxID=2038737 RepID=UPI00298C51BA|nr:SIR2 family protein [Flavobacterium ardleyense]
MVIDDILVNNKDYFSFETFVISLLKLHIESQNKSYRIVNHSSLGDAVADSGFDDFNGKTIIEIKPILQTNTILQILHHFRRNSLKIDNTFAFENLLVISSRKISLNAKILAEQIIKTHDLSGVNITFWGPDELNKIIAKHKKEATNIANNLFTKRLENALSVETKDWKIERDERLNVLKDIYSKGQFSLFLGAGVSASAGMADWNTLLNSLFVTYLTNEFSDDKKIIEKDITEIVSRLNNLDETSAIMAARYLRKALVKNTKEETHFLNAITENLYSLRDKIQPIDSTLLHSITNLCMPMRTGAKVRSVITYNFDDLLERILELKNIKHHSVYIDNDFCDPEDLPVYHVHGFLPENRKKYTALQKSTLVFSEEGYHLIYSDSYHWSNLVQLSNLRDSNCLMIGLSMTDPNLRRLLDISARNLDKPRHFALMKRISHSKFCYQKDKQKNPDLQIVSNLKAASNFLEVHHKLNEDLMRELGVTIIWYENYEDIPLLLDKLNI